MTIRLSPLTSELFLRSHTVKLRLLATDPDPVLLQIYRAYFPYFGFEVVTAGDGLRCLELLRDFLPDALILSLELTWGGAEGVLAIVREETAMRPIPVVLTFDQINRPKAVKHLLPPVDKLLEKPFGLHDLQASVEAALGARANRPGPGDGDRSAAFGGTDGRPADKHNPLTTGMV
jgi:two-component system OmpR family response regulator